MKDEMTARLRDRYEIALAKAAVDFEDVLVRLEAFDFKGARDAATKGQSNLAGITLRKGPEGR